MATRQLYWNIEGHWLLYPLFLIALGFFAYGVYRRVALWKLGQPDYRTREVWQRIKDVLIYGVGHTRILRKPFPGIMHLFIFGGFVVLAFATSIVAIQADLGINVFKGSLYLFIKFTANLFGLLALVGIGMASWRRYVKRSPSLDNKTEDAIPLILIAFLLVTGFLIEGVRMASVHDPWSQWGFVGAWLAVLLKSSFPQHVLYPLHQFLWWFHLALTMLFIGYLPYSKMFHMILGPINIFLRKHGPVGIPELIDFEDESLETYGKSKLQDLSWKNLFESDACLRCGRCQENCPAHLSGKHLNPKNVIQELRNEMVQTGLNVVSQKSLEGGQGLEIAATAENPMALEGKALIGEVIPENDLWSCTTCRSCEQQCPIFVEHVDKTIEFRRNLVLMESRFPQEAQLAFRNLENNGNPWGRGWSTREDFLKKMDVPTYSENPEAEILFWPGCSGSFDARNQKVVKSLVKLLKGAGINFAILGNEEKCCGDSARRLGNEYLFYSLALENISIMKEYGVKKIVTQCPHCFNMLKNEYPQFGGEFEVYHHTEFLWELVKAKQIQFKTERSKPAGIVTFHDSCYLGRYNQIYTQPRELLKVAGLKLKEMPRNREKSFCCGAGGGRMWLEEHEGERINIMRVNEAINVNPDTIGTSCPFCLTMFNDGLSMRDEGESIKAFDIAEILEEIMIREKEDDY
jgi:Fe-S oxidoreductase/nitrate reductase gamma subunit